GGGHQDHRPDREHGAAVGEPGPVPLLRLRHRPGDPHPAGAGALELSATGATTLPELETPALLIDLDALEANLAEMAAVAARAGVRLRPHTKTHKAPEIARMQVEAGAAGITVAKLGEAEVMADGGLEDLLIAFPLVGERKLTRLRELLERADVRVSLDAVEVAEGVGRVGKDLGRDVPVLVEVDTGLHRMGRAAGDPSARLALDIASV